jgi:uncharacterized protein
LCLRHDLPSTTHERTPPQPPIHGRCAAVSTGLLALLDDLTALAKLVSASVDDAAAQAAKAGSKAITKASGIVIDDAAVTPRYVIGFAADRELPIIARIAVGSLKNKLLFLLPGALLINYFTPWVLTPLLMLGGVYLAYEGYGKVADLFRPGLIRPGDGAAPPSPGAEDSGSSKELENARIASAIRTDFILSAEILAITLSTVASASVGVQAAALSIVGVGMTVAVYGAVALIVKADDAGAALAQNTNAMVSAVGRGIVRGMPLLLALLGTVGMVAMLWVGGGILIHGAHELGWKAPELLLQSLGAAAGRSVAGAAGLVSWVVTAGISAVVGLAVGAVAAPVAGMFSGARQVSNKNG